MSNITFITGNEHKARYVAQWLERPVAHHKLNLEEIQSLDLEKVVTHKALQAYELLEKRVLVEDVALTFTGMGRLPGTLIKWFLEELGNEGLCEITRHLPSRAATATVMYGLCDEHGLRTFVGEVQGEIAPAPKGSKGFGWNPIFIPEGSAKTYAQMSDDELRPFSHRLRAIEKLAAYLHQEFPNSQDAS